MIRFVKRISNQIIHVEYEPGSNNFNSDFVKYDFEWNNRKVLAQTRVSFTPKTVYKYEIDGEPIIKKKMTANGEVSYVENSRQIPCGESYSASITFTVGENELLLGMGQYEDGIFNYRNKTEYLYESNMRIAIPFLVTTGGYGILIDSESNMIFESKNNTVTFSIDTLNSLSYYVFLGDNIQEIINGYHRITGKPSMLPRWAFGYIQSKERYNDSEEILSVAEEFRKREIPVDCIVQDWYSWEEGLWGEKIFDKKRYPNLCETINKLHDENVRFMVSIWPNMSPDSSNYREFKEENMLLPNSNLYDAYREDARDLYWKQCDAEIMSSGTDALWCDNAEPFSDADWSGEKKKSEIERYMVVTDFSKESADWDKLNSYGYYHAKGIYDNWRKSYPSKRVVNLTRSGYSGCQALGTILWSGDICATWDTLRKQIVEGMKMGLSGMPYWTFDIGGFFVVKDKYENRGCNDTSHMPLWFWQGDYNDGVNDPAYRELYVRWLQLGAFLPIFRSHGTDTPREPWQFGDKGDIFYDSICDFIKLRYKLMPYIYSLGAAAHFEGQIIMRSLVMDFASDPEVLGIVDEYMFGPAFLVAPVYKPMYYSVGGEAITDAVRTRKVYLPKGYGWYDYYTNEYYEGGRWIEASAPIEKIPLFVKAGSIIPICTKPITYADEYDGKADDFIKYPGADGSFKYYTDDGDGYGFETGEYTVTEMKI